MTTETDQASQNTLDLARRWIDRLSNQDIQGLDAILSDDHVYCAMWCNPPEYRTRYSKQRFFKEIADWQPIMKVPVTMKIISEYAHGDRAFLETESHGVLHDGYVYANAYSFHFWMRNGKITEIHDYCCTYTARLLEEHLRSAFPGDNLFDELDKP